MITKKQPVVVVKRFDDREGNPKEFPMRVGTLLEFDNGNQILELNMFPDLEMLVMPEAGRNY